MKLTDTIFQIVEDHSGGVKYLELLMMVLSQHYKEPIPQLEIVVETDLSDFIFEEIKKMNDLAILEYVHRPLNKVKYFVYTKEEEKDSPT